MNTNAATGSGRVIQAHQAIAEDIKALGVDTVFGLMSDDTAVFCTALDGLGIAFHGARHENNAIAMAEGYALPPAASASPSLAAAPPPQRPARHGRRQPHGLEAADHLWRAGPANRRGEPDGAGLQELQRHRRLASRRIAHLRRHVRHRRTHRLGRCRGCRRTGNHRRAAAAHQRAAYGDRSLDRHAPRRTRAAQDGRPTRASHRRSRRGAAREQEADIVAGRGAHLAGAKEAIEALAERSGALLITTAKGKDMFRGHPFNLGILGSFSHSMARRMVDQADCAVVFGAGLNFLTMSFGASLPPVPLIQVDSSRASIGRYSHADVAVVGDAKLAAEGIVAALPSAKTRRSRSSRKRCEGMLAGFDIERTSSPPTPRARWTCTASARRSTSCCPEQKNIVYDAGNFLGILPYLSVPGPGHFKMTSEFASIGLGFGTALGVAKGRPDIPTVPRHRGWRAADDHG